MEGGKAGDSPPLTDAEALALYPQCICEEEWGGVENAMCSI